MPTVILLDVSLSMCRTVKNSTSKNDPCGEPIEIKRLAIIGIGNLLDYFAQNCQLEYTTFLVFSSLWEVRHPFSRHHESLKNSIYDLEIYDKSNIVNAVRGALSQQLKCWITRGPINIILITDGQLYHESMCNGSRNSEGENVTPRMSHQDIPLSELEGLFDFPCKIQVVCLSSPREPALKHSLPFYKRLVSYVDTSVTDCPVIVGSNMKNVKQSAIWLPESDTQEISIESVENMFSRIADLHYKPYRATLSCGHLSSIVMLSPSPTDCLLEPLKNEFDDLKNEQSLREEAKETYVSAINKIRLYKLSGEINVCGFMPLAEIASPSVTSRHLVLPIVNTKFDETSKAEQILSQDPNAYKKSTQACPMDESIDAEVSNKRRGEKAKGQDGDAGKTSKQGTGDHTVLEQDVTRQPSFCMLLHNGLKQENMVAICIVGKSEETNEDWFGMLHINDESKKRSGLMLSLLTPGPNPVLWLPPFRALGSSTLNSDLPTTIRDKIASNKVLLKSYSSNNVLWLDPESVQTDVQKIVRHAKRSPDKAPHFYKELNRIRRAAISYGFYDVLSGLAAILEREKRAMLNDQSKSVCQETIAHIDHVVECLRSDLNEDSYETNITPKV